MKIQEWAFIDLENIGSLNKISVQKYDVVYVFVGANQAEISLAPTSTDKFTEIKILKIKNISKNNLDFHLSYYLGKCDSQAGKDVKFTVVSNDTGFDNVIKHIQATGRNCVRSKVESKEETVTKKILLDLLNKDIEKMPKSEGSLKNVIGSHLGSNKSEKRTELIYKYLVRNKKIADRIKVAT